MFKKVHTFRVKSKQELITEISHYCSERGITSGVVIGIIGSVESARLNFLMKLPGEYDSVAYSGPLEIVCAQGSVALIDDNTVIHISIFTRTGKVLQIEPEFEIVS